MEALLIDVYWFLAVLGSVVFTLRLLLMVTGIGGDDGDLDDAGDSDGAFTWFSIQALSVLALGTGWFGLLAQETWGLPAAIAGLIAIGSGVLLTLLVARALRLVFRLEESGTLDVDRAVGASGTVYLTIPEDGVGQVQVNVDGRLVTLDATAGSRRIETGAAISVDTIDGRGVAFVSPAWSPLS